MRTISRLNALLEVILSSPPRIRRVLVQKGIRKPRIDEIVEAAREKGLALRFVSKRQLDGIDRNHQGALAFLTPREFSSLDSLLERSDCPLLVLLDGIEDPQNFGAIIRTAQCGGADGIVFQERRSVGLTEAVSRVSAGAAEHLPLCRVANLARAMDDLRKRDVWLVGAEGDGDSLWYDFDYTLPVALVLGSEGKGLRELIRKKCDRILSLPVSGEISSLNVAAAASIFIYEVVRQREK